MYKKIFGGLLGAWLVGFCFFIYSIPSCVVDRDTKTDAIVALTGGAARINEGFLLLKNNMAPRLFISGVNPRENLDSVLKSQQNSTEYQVNLEQKSLVSLGFRARTTLGNAIETAPWIHEQNIQSIRLVTSALHMQRSVLEFQRLIPDLQIIQHPVFAAEVPSGDLWTQKGGLYHIFQHPDTIIFLVREYQKYLMAIFHLQRLFRHNID